MRATRAMVRFLPACLLPALSWTKCRRRFAHLMLCLVLRAEEGGQGTVTLNMHEGKLDEQQACCSFVL